LRSDGKQLQEKAACLALLTEKKMVIKKVTLWSLYALTGIFAMETGCRVGKKRKISVCCHRSLYIFACNYTPSYRDFRSPSIQRNLLRLQGRESDIKEKEKNNVDVDCDKVYDKTRSMATATPQSENKPINTHES